VETLQRERFPLTKGLRPGFPSQGACPSMGFWYLCAHMKHWFQWLFLVGATWLAPAAELKFDFGATPQGKLPDGFRSALFGSGPASQWQVVYESAPSAFRSILSTNTSSVRPVLAQLSKEPTDERYPLAIFDRETFSDFTFTTRFKVVDGVEEQMAGIIFRVVDDKNFYVLRANAKDGNVRFYKVVNGARTPPIGNNLPVSKGEWHELSVECKGNQIRCSFNGKPIGERFEDNSFTAGKVGFWTKSDSVSYFADAMVRYVPRESLAQSLVTEAMTKFSRLRGLRIYAPQKDKNTVAVVAAADPREIGILGGEAEKETLAKGTVFHLKEKGDISVYMGVHDRNGDIVGVVRVTMESFMGQTEQNAIMRAMPVIKTMEARLAGTTDPFN
jgi:hypothetical protein